MANNVDLDSPGVKDLLANITFDMPAQSTTSIVGYVDGAVDAAFIETSTGYTASAQDKGLSLNFWRVWFGIPVRRWNESIEGEANRQLNKARGNYEKRLLSPGGAVLTSVAVLRGWLSTRWMGSIKQTLSFRKRMI